MSQYELETKKEKLIIGRIAAAGLSNMGNSLTYL